MGKYFKYALGEILLVVIGILIALQVNNWNNQRLERQKEQTILMNLRSDFNENIAEYNRIYKSSTESYKSSIKLLEIIKGDSNINPSEIEVLLNSILNGFYSLDLNAASIDEIKSSGSLNIIKDGELRKQISKWSFMVDDTEDDIEIYYDYLFEFLIPSLTNKSVLRNMAVPRRLNGVGNLSQITKSNFSVDYDTTLRTLEFENQLYNHTLNLVFVLQAYENIEAYLQGTLEMIEGNIND
ncbi:DUF6090 family protein [Winogradskyella poriferorum]|uniref:DUF6090 family protein n=1 Tax=Winogradskyella poriferorum TaxID=307627 RepID=UPI003D65C69E